MRWTQLHITVLLVMHHRGCDDECIASVLRLLGRTNATDHIVRSARVRYGMSERKLSWAEHYEKQYLYDQVARDMMLKRAEAA